MSRYPKINTKATNVHEIFPKDIKVKKIAPSVYELYDGQKKYLDIIVKTYNDINIAIGETMRLKQLEKVPNVSKVIKENLRSNFSFVLLKKCGQEDLFSYFYRKHPIEEYKVKIIIKKLLEIVDNIHEQKVIHGDIKAENVMIDHRTDTITLIDFEENQYTEYYIAPESINDNKYTEKTDVWSIGILTYLLLFRQYMFYDEYEITNKEVQIPDTFGYLVEDFLYCLLDKDPDNRYDCKDALEHPWLKIN